MARIRRRTRAKAQRQPRGGSLDGQDVWLLHHAFAGVSAGFFVEAGANNGLNQSNTWLFAQHGWQGLLIEPGREFAKLLDYRKESICLPICLAQYDGEAIDFGEDMQDSMYSGRIEHIPAQLQGRRKQVTQRQALSLGMAMNIVGAPTHVDYLSLDTEGSEVEILKGIPFARYSFGAISVELNGHDAEIAELLDSHGYQLVKVCRTDGIYLPEDRVVAQSE